MTGRRFPQNEIVTAQPFWSLEFRFQRLIAIRLFDSTGPYDLTIHLGAPLHPYYPSETAPPQTSTYQVLSNRARDLESRAKALVDPPDTAVPIFRIFLETRTPPCVCPNVREG